MLPSCPDCGGDLQLTEGAIESVWLDRRVWTNTKSQRCAECEEWYLTPAEFERITAIARSAERAR